MRKTRIQSVICLAFIVILIAIVMVLPVSSIKVEGARIALDVEPSMTYREPIVLSLPPSDHADSFALVVAGFGQSPFDGTYMGLDPGEDTSPWSARPFITLENTVLSLGPGESGGTNVTVDVPEDTNDGGRYALILVYPVASLSAQTVPAPVALIPVFLSIQGGNSTESGEITALEITTQESGEPLQISTYFLNTGNHHFYGAVNTVTITDREGAVVARAETLPFEKALIPGQEVRFVVSIDEPLPDREYLLTSRMETKDGTLLAEQKESLEGNGKKEVDIPPATPLARKSPGFSIDLGLLALACVSLGSVWIKRW